MALPSLSARPALSFRVAKNNREQTLGKFPTRAFIVPDAPNLPNADFWVTLAHFRERLPRAGRA